MKEKNYGKLSKKARIIAIAVVCVIFAFVCVTCLNLQKKTNEIIFHDHDVELNSAVLRDDTIVSTEETEDYTFKTKPFILPAGNYLILLRYASTAGGSVLVQGSNDCVFNLELPATDGNDQTITDDRLILPMGTDKGCIKFFREGSGEITVKEIRILSPKRIYNDYYAIIILAGLIAAGLITVILLFNRLRISRIGLSYIGMLLIVLVIVNIPFFTKGTYYEIDTQGHMKRIEAIAQGVRDRQLPVIIGPNYANQYGELVALQPDLFLYIPALLRLLNVSIPTAYNIYMILVNVATAFFAVVCGERLFTSLRWGIVAAVFYLIEPFRLYVMMDLGAGAGMGTALVFLPCVIVGLYNVMNRKGFRWQYLAIGLWGIASSHVLGFALAAIVIFFYAIFHLRILLRKETILALLKAVALFTVMTLGTLAPFVGFYFTDWDRSALQWTDFYHFDVSLSREILNLIAVAVMLISLIGILKRKLLSQFGRGIFITGFISVVLSLSIFPWFLFKNVPYVDSFLSMMQYPMRFHFMAVTSVAFVAAEAVCAHMDARTKIRRKLLYSITGLLAIGVIINFYEFYESDKLFYDPMIGEVNTIMEDYLPGGTQTEWYATDTGSFSDYDEVEAFSYSKMNTHIDCTYVARSDGQFMDFPLFYYEGYVAHDQNGAPLKVEKGEHNRVRVYLTKSDEEQELHLFFKVKRIYKVLFLFSLLACAVWFSYRTILFAKRNWNSERITRA